MKSSTRRSDPHCEGVGCSKCGTCRPNLSSRNGIDQALHSAVGGPLRRLKLSLKDRTIPPEISSLSSFLVGGTCTLSVIVSSFLWRFISFCFDRAILLPLPPTLLLRRSERAGADSLEVSLTFALEIDSLPRELFHRRGPSHVAR